MIILLSFLLLLCLFGLVASTVNGIIERDHKKGRHWNKPQPDTCVACRDEKYKNDSIS